MTTGKMHLQTAAPIVTTTTTTNNNNNMALPTLPASPTLTNPDMILPYGEYDETASPQNSYQPPLPGEDWNPATMQFSIGPPSQRLPVSPETQIIYGNGTMLSDIGEVTETESTAGRKLPGPAERRMLKKQASAQAVARASPTAHDPARMHTNAMKRAKTGAHSRNISTESTSTITSEGPPAEIFKDFDDSVSVEDSVFQGDDEGSVADSYTVGVIASETERLAKKENMDDQDEDQNSSAALSRRAEQILLNAKMRLNNMEGNLTRARGNLGSVSIHSSSPLSRPSPPLIHNTKTPVDSPMASPGHSRVLSDNSIPKLSKSMRFPVRSASAAARYRGRSMEDLSRSESPDHSLNKARSTTPKHSPPHKVALEPLSENEVPDFGVNRSSRTSSIDDGYASGGSEVRGLTRPPSLSQMRDLKDQMSDLKGRLSVLRDRARDDTMKRKSLQSLRTPSPFTAAEQWYTADTSYTAPGLSADAGVGLPSPSKEEKQKFEFDSMPLSAVGAGSYEYAPSESTSVYEDVVEEQPRNGMAIGQPISDDDFDTATENGKEPYFDDASEYTEEMVNRDELDDYDSDASLYHDTVAHPISHEDREDAFDYEHFYLHSAMGTIGRDRRSSMGSDDSVETTVPDRKLQERPSLTRLRSESANSVSTVNTFKTATEGRGSDSDGERDPYAVRQVRTPRPITPVTTKRSTFGSPAVNTEGREDSRPVSAIHNPIERTSSTSHRPSVSSTGSHGSTGTARSFPLVNKPKSQLSLLQNGSSGSPTSSSQGDRTNSSPVHMLSEADQLLVESLVASLGKCVLGLQDASGGGYEGRVWRRRLDAARRTLEGEEGAV